MAAADGDSYRLNGYMLAVTSCAHDSYLLSNELGHLHSSVFFQHFVSNSILCSSFSSHSIQFLFFRSASLFFPNNSNCTALFFRFGIFFTILISDPVEGVSDLFCHRTESRIFAIQTHRIIKVYYCFSDSPD